MAHPTPEIPAEYGIDVQYIIAPAGIRRPLEHDVVEFGEISVHPKILQFLLEQILLLEPRPRRIHLPQVPANHRVGGNPALPRADHPLPLRMHVEVVRSDIQKLQN